MKRRLLLLLLLGGLLSDVAPGAEELSGVDFLNRARRQADASSYAMLEGYVQHAPKNGKMVEVPAYLGVLITPDGSRARFIIDNDEVYDIIQLRSPGGQAVTGVTPAREGGYPDSLAEQFHLDPADLTTGFLFYDFQREEETERVKGIACRVFLMKNPAADELVRVYIAREYYFPLKAEFFRRSEATGKPDKTLETASFKKQNDLYYAELINLYGPDWRSRVSFTRAEVGVPVPGENYPIFREPETGGAQQQRNRTEP